MTNAASEAETDPKKLASRHLILTLASIHTSVMTVFYALFDLLKYPEYIEPLREEILALVKDNGDDAVQNLSKQSPPSAGPSRPSPSRMAQSCPRAFASASPSVPSLRPGGDLRWLPPLPQAGQDGPAHKDHLLFGSGRRPCPGRFWAVGEVKMILAMILVGMDFHPARDGETSRTYFINELSFPDPRTKLLMRAGPKVSHN